eukprot:5570918-Pyramimonas_sp.AAC.1
MNDAAKVDAEAYSHEDLYEEAQRVNANLYNMLVLTCQDKAQGIVMKHGAYCAWSSSPRCRRASRGCWARSFIRARRKTIRSKASCSGGR